MTREPIEQSGEFSVCQFFHDESYEYVRQNVDAESAVRAFDHYMHSVAVQLGVVSRVIITDGGDCTVAEWKKGEGLIFPTQEDIQNAKDAESKRS